MRIWQNNTNKVLKLNIDIYDLEQKWRFEDMSDGCIQIKIFSLLESVQYEQNAR